MTRPRDAVPLRATASTCVLPDVLPGLFLEAGITVAQNGVHAGVTSGDLDSILTRAASQAALLLTSYGRMTADRAC